MRSTPRGIDERLGNRGAIAPGQGPREGETLVRLVTSFETNDEEVDALLALARPPHARRNS